MISSYSSTHRRLVPAPTVAAMLAVLVLVGCAGGSRQPPRQTLTVATRNSPTTYYEDRAGALAGLEYDLVTEFANAQGLEVKFLVLDSIGEILQAVEEGRADVAAAGLTRTAVREEAFTTGPDYQEIEEQVVCHPGAGVEEVPDLIGKRIQIISDSSYEETLLALAPEYPGLEWTASDEASTEQLLELVALRAIDCTVADSNIVALDSRVLPELRAPFALGEKEYLSWFLSEVGVDLVGPIDAWFEQMRSSGRLQEVLDRYYWQVGSPDYYDTSIFFRRVEKRLPAYEEMFLTAEAASKLDWRLLAAVAYQESHWDPEAVSRTGVRGLMMLTEQTALELGVDRTDPFESILGGAAYLGDLIERIPAFVPEPDRTHMALAAYNVGYSHLEDARKLAVELGVDANSWAAVSEVLPLLSQPKHYRKLRHGYARGSEPVAFVENVRNYYDLLAESFSRVEEEQLPPGVMVSTALLPPDDDSPE